MRNVTSGGGAKASGKPCGVIIASAVALTAIMPSAGLPAPWACGLVRGSNANENALLRRPCGGEY